MAINFSAVLYSPCQDMFGRGILVTPVASQPGVDSYYARGIHTTGNTTVQTETGVAFITDQQTFLYIREVEFDIPPKIGDLIEIPADGAIPAEGVFEVVDSSRNGGGEIELSIREYSTPLQTPLIRVS